MAVPFGTVPAQSGDYECRSGNLATVRRDAVFVAPETRARRARVVSSRRNQNKSGTSTSNDQIVDLRLPEQSFVQVPSFV